MYSLCVFAGTSEGRALIERLSGRGVSITACVATEYGEILLGEKDDVRVRAGRMDAEQMTAFLKENRFDAVCDATHPYAAAVTANIVTACEAAETPYLRLERAGTSAAEDGVFADDAKQCAEYLMGTTGNILLTTGSKELLPYAALRERIYARVLPMAESLEACAAAGIPPKQIIAMQGPFTEEMNTAMLRSVNAKYMVTKDTGKAGGYGDKIRAAKAAGAIPVIIGRPVSVRGQSPEAVLKALEDRFSLAPRKKRVALVGIGMGDPDTMTAGARNAFRNADCVIGAKRMLAAIDTGNARTREAVLARDIAGFIRADEGRDYAVALSGDTGFYSGAKGLLAALDQEEVRVLPGVGSLSYFCAKLGRAWQDVRAVSLHGRGCDLAYEVKHHESVFTLLGRNGVNEALETLRAAGLGHTNAFVGERLGYPDEKITRGTAEALLGGTYDDLSVLLIDNPKARETAVTPGLPDEAFERDEVPMTKSEVRAVSLAKLALTPYSVVYDIGSGSGSVTVECALQAPYGKVYAVERKDSAVALTKRNCEKFHLTNTEVIAGYAPEVLDPLPAPTHAFIGGSAGNMDRIIDVLLQKNPYTRVVVNAVTLETVSELTALCARFDFSDIACITAAKPRKVGGYHLMTGQNPVYIFTFQNMPKEESEC